jgi:hypothetical protein
LVANFDRLPGDRFQRSALFLREVRAKRMRLVQQATLLPASADNLSQTIGEIRKTQRPIVR